MVNMSKSERSKEQLIAVATTLFAERGLRGVTVRDIAAEAGVSHSMIFRHFGGLDGLIAASFEHLSQKIGQSSKAFEPLPNMDEFKSLLDKLSDNDELVKMLIHGLLEQDRRFEDPDHLAFKRLVAGFDKKQGDGGIPGALDSQLLAIASTSLVVGWMMIEPRIPELLCEPELDLQTLRHRAAEMCARLVATNSP